MAKKTSKTAHVMNLLTKSDGIEETKVEKNDSVTVTENGQTAGENTISDQISNALEDALLSDGVKVDATPVAQEEIDEEVTVADLESAKPVSSASNATDRLTSEDGSENIYINVMEQIVVDIRDYYMEKFGLCTCDMCTMDVTALTLNLLPPKYTVTHKGEVFAKLATFSQQYSADIITAITKACIKVKESPRH